MYKPQITRIGFQNPCNLWFGLVNRDCRRLRKALHGERELLARLYGLFVRRLEKQKSLAARITGG